MKNERLSEQRKRRAEAEEKQGIRKSKKKKPAQGAAPAGAEKEVGGMDGVDEKRVMERKGDGRGGAMGDMHPSRLARMR